MAEKNKGFFRESLDFFRKHWGELLTISHIGMSLFSGKMSDKAPDAAKAFHTTMGGVFGGEGSPKDEATYKRLLPKMVEVFRMNLYTWVGMTFPVMSEERWIRVRARARLEEWRVIVTAIAAQSEDNAVEYLNGIGQRMGVALEKESAKYGKPLEEFTSEERIECLQKAALAVTHEMALEGTPIPYPDVETPMGVTVQKFARAAFQLGSNKSVKAYQYALLHAPVVAERVATEAREALRSNSKKIRERNAKRGVRSTVLRSILPFTGRNRRPR